MDLKFVEILKGFLPKGKAWENQENTFKIFEAVSDEFSLIHAKGASFYKNYNLVQDESLATEYSNDYLIYQGLYSNLELQRIIVEYINRGYEFKDAVEDFSEFIGVPINWTFLPYPMEFGDMQFGDEFGDASVSRVMELLIEFEEDVTCADFNKIKALVQYLQPPYLSVQYTNTPTDDIVALEFGEMQFGDEMGELITCSLV